MKRLNIPPARSISSALALAALVAASPGTASAAAPLAGAMAQEMSACLALAEKVSDDAFESALAWEDRGGGEHARLCQALALFHRGQFDKAAPRLEELVPSLGAAGPEEAASLLAQAGWAWLRAGNVVRAEASYDRAIALSPGDPDLLVDRSFARAEGGDWAGAADDLSRAIELRPGMAEAWMYRAEARRALDRPAEARADLDRALELDPQNPEALLMRGNLRAETGDVAGAREDWTRTARIDPDTTTARAAEDNLKRFAGK